MVHIYAFTAISRLITQIIYSSSPLHSLQVRNKIIGYVKSNPDKVILAYTDSNDIPQSLASIDSIDVSLDDFTDKLFVMIKSKNGL